jgi:hypothetical protein
MTKEHTWRRWELLAAVGAACWIEKLVTLEWSYPYCSVRDSGAAAAVFGFPLPYEQASIVSSATWFFIPWLYVVDLAAIAGGVFLLLRPLASRLGTLKPRAHKIIFGATGSVLLMTAIAFDVSVLSMGVWRPTSSFAGSPRFSELRPVSLVVIRRQRDCTASPFWFPNNAQPRQ